MDDIPTIEEFNNVINLNPMIQQNKKKRCKCKNKKFNIDFINREVTCSKCGQIVEPFEALVELTLNDGMYNAYIRNRYKMAIDVEKWIHKHKEPIALKNVIEQYKKDLRPYCPHCKKMIDLTKILSWGHKGFLNSDK